MGYHAPYRLNDALTVLAGGGPVAVVAGGTDHYPALGDAPEPAVVLDLTRIEGLRGITRAADGGWRIGATTTWTDIAVADLPPAFAGLQQAARMIGGVQIQNAGTIGGNLCNASPAADGVPPLLALDARVTLAGPDGTRDVPLAGFVTGARQTARRPGELVTQIALPAPPNDLRGAFCKLGARRYLVISIAMVAACIARDAHGRITDARVAVGACSAVAQRLTALEQALIGQHAGAPEMPAHAFDGLAPIDDIRADAAYRRAAVAEACGRAIRAAGSA
ncbi:MAG: FAD binding domain-containing protein [Rhodobacteraceae bacterium]|nr:FAD binding domain-containing protein [Paracoccaceae bacterium]